MTARGGRNNIVARRVIDDLIDISGERSPLKYLKIFIEQQIINQLEASGDYEDVFNLVMELRDDSYEANHGNSTIDDQDPLVNYDNDNENDNLGYQSEEYFDEVQEDDENNHSNGNLRYYDVDLRVRKLVMNRLGQLLRNFRRKLRQTYILHNQNTLSKLNEVPAKYSAILQAKEWVNFVKFTAAEEYKVKPAAAKMARSKSKKKEIEPDTEFMRGTLWLKGRVNIDGEYPDDEIRSVGDKLKETEDKIKEGTLKVDHGTDAMTIVLGKEKGGYARGVGSGVTYKRYFDLPRSRQASDERILLLQSQLDNERRERQEKELLIQNLSNKMSQTEGMVTTLKNQLAAQGGQFQSMSTQLTPPNVSSVDINPINSNANEEGVTTIFRCENDVSIQKSNGLVTLEKEMETRLLVFVIVTASQQLRNTAIPTKLSL
ncbi:hypothetical protein Tco_0007333 [Tanacetum coccineum]